ncbi:unnamed protein product [Rhizophagus irregularis]|nr:unnamed protein product [Rhizophagus irregularis]
MFIKEIVNELKLQREVDFHDNIIRFYGVATEVQSDNSKRYMLVMEYADGGTLRKYLKENFEILTWNDKFNMALQLASAVSCLHDEGIMHRDLHSNNVGQRPFYAEGKPYDIGLAVEILQGLREKPIPNTPENYIKIYTDCWNGEPINRPTINQLMN